MACSSSTPARWTSSGFSPSWQGWPPNYEMPTDANRDNVYEVTVRASDGTLYEDRMVQSHCHQMPG